jgi:hypothetical protein
VYRCTKFHEKEFSDAIREEEFSTGDKNLHLDINPWWWEDNAREILDGLDKSLTYMDEQVRDISFGFHN